MQDTFGRLPNDVIHQITSLYQTPLIDFIPTKNKNYISFMITSQTCKFGYHIPVPLIVDFDGKNLYVIANELICYKI